MTDKLTPLAKALAERSDLRATPLTAFRQARQWWLEGRRLNLSALAEELGVSRATLMRWVGNKELLLGEILWSLYKAEFDRAKTRADETPDLTGLDYLAQIYHDINEALIDAKPLRQFLSDDPKFGLQVLTANVSGLQERLVGVWEALIVQQLKKGTIRPQLPAGELAYYIVRIGQGALYSDIICGREPALEPADTAFRLLFSELR
ncbi:hypothetical protein CAI21_10300 [Alkalilimnicola ehrlichii]|uniref:QsdR TetR regulatory C-terminal domain-containing protein n=1 Tax=Alkalilimnicola ehrlichii TaxID=351052 RepID=A0A3E0WSW7_9GAMM|nr:QsdR family transcriptional regulator [Alkalilimnicola ehrlichii]RFA29152.1 hypothetical protein CAI21_10300 [Alkalilimnicola ehrlichii]RFA36064.1 hypothetical protein CAL65_11450 [Alkalilimnicola ehrlichii]